MALMVHEDEGKNLGPRRRNCRRVISVQCASSDNNSDVPSVRSPRTAVPPICNLVSRPTRLCRHTRWPNGGFSRNSSLVRQFSNKGARHSFSTEPSRSLHLPSQWRTAAHAASSHRATPYAVNDLANSSTAAGRRQRPPRKGCQPGRPKTGSQAMPTPTTGQRGRTCRGSQPAPAAQGSASVDHQRTGRLSSLATSKQAWCVAFTKLNVHGTWQPSTRNIHGTATGTGDRI